MNERCSNPVPPEIQAEVDALAGLPEDQIDIEDISEVGGMMLSGGCFIARLRCTWMLLWIGLRVIISRMRVNTVRLRKKCKIFQRENEVFSF
jgi:hypothetical protein